MVGGKDTAVKTKPLISKENAQNRLESKQRETVLGVSAFPEQTGNLAMKRRYPLCPVCRNTSRENGHSLSKQFKDKTAVNDVNLTLIPGIWGLLGANGAGKTTLMRMMADIMTPRLGHFRWQIS